MEAHQVMGRLEYWYDSHHTGALRAIDPDTHTLYGSDPREPAWQCPYVVMSTSPLTLHVNFATHRGPTNMVAVYHHHRNQLHWCDGNVWYRIRHDPRILFHALPHHVSSDGPDPHSKRKI